MAWSIPTDGTTYISTPAISDSLVFFAPGDLDPNVYAVWLSDGQIYWKTAGNPGLTKARADALNEMPLGLLPELRRMSPEHRRAWLEVYRKQGAPFARRFSLSKRLQRTADNFAPSAAGVRTSSVAVDSMRAYVIQRELGYSADIEMRPMSRFTLLAIDKGTGTEAWRFTDYRNSQLLGYNSSPIVASNKVFAGWGEGKVYALDATNGVKLWEDSLQGHVISSPAIADRRLYVATMDGLLYCYELSGTPAGIDFAQSTFCYPNPARRGISNIQVYVTRPAQLTMVIYNTNDKPVAVVRESINGKYTYRWDLSRVANGAYFAYVRVQYDDGTEEKKVVKIAVLN
jgi:hypothetical protein